MQLIQCTGKLQKEMGLKKKDFCDDQADTSVLGSWHANLIFIDRKKCVLFVNDRTLLNFIVPDVNRKQIQNLGDLFRSWLSCVLMAEGFDAEVVERVMADYESLGFTKTGSKSVLGSMNDLAINYRFRIQDVGGVYSAEVPAIISALNHMPMGMLEYSYSINVAEELILNTYDVVQ